MRHALKLLLLILVSYVIPPSAVQAASGTDPDDQLLTVVLSLQTNVSCYGGHNGLAVVAAVGGVPPFVFVWANGTVGPINANLSAGVHTVTCTDLLGATATFNVNITQPAQLLVNVAAQVDVNCLNVSGSATVATNGGTGGSSLLWSNGQTGITATNLAAGAYQVTATDANGCTSVKTVNINADLQLPTVNIDLNADLQVDCNSPLVSLDASASSGGPEYAFLWTTVNGHIAAGTTSNIASVDAAGTYLLKITDSGNGCTQTQSATVTANLTLPVVNINAGAGVDLQLDCLTSQLTLDGTGSATGSGIGYLWTTVNGHIVAGANLLNGVVVDAAGTYTLHVTNANNGCSSQDDVTLTVDLDLPLVNINAGAGVDLQLDCLTPQLTLDGTGSVTGSGIVYLWTTVNGHIVAGANTLANVVVDAAGTYTLHVTDGSNGCSNSSSVNVLADLVLPLVDIAADVNVDLQLDCLTPQITLDATASTSGNGIAYLWTTVNGHIVAGGNTLLATVDAAGQYTLVISDGSNGCTASASVNVTLNAQLPTIVVNVNGQLGCSNSSLVLDASASSQGSNFIYLWTTLDGNIMAGANTLTPTVNAAGTYTLVITNLLNGCTASVDVTVTGQAVLNVSLTNLLNVSCFGLANGSVTLNVSGGAAPYTYLWSNGMTTATVSGLAAGAYVAIVTDANGCQSTINVNIGQPAAQLNATATTTPSTGSNNGTATISVTGGTAPYTYLWSNGMTTASATGLAAGTYTVTVTDAAGCQITITIVVTSQANCTISVSATAQAATCNQNNGQASAQATGGSGNVTYTWSNGATGATISNLTAGTYSVTATDAQGCTAVGSVSVTTQQDNTPPVVLTQNVTLALDASGNATLTTAMVDNGTADACGGITLILDQTSFNCTTLGTHIVVLTATDQNGNSASGTALVTVVDNIAPTLQCPADLTVNTGAGVVNYDAPEMQDNCAAPNVTLVLLDGFASGSVFPSGVTTVTYAAVGSGGVGASCSFTVTVTGGILVLDFDLTPPSCPGSADGSITVNVSGGTGNYTYLWVNANGQTSATATGLSAGVYTVVIVDDAGNVAVQTVVLPDPPGLSVSLVVLMDNCNGTGSIDVTVTGGTPPYTYAWYDANGNLFATTEDLDSIPSGAYTLVVTDASGCSFTTGVITLNLSTGVVESELDSSGTVSLSPNPTPDGHVQLAFNLPQISAVRVESFNANGQQVGGILENDAVQNETMTLDLSSLPAGHYMLKIITANRTYLKKVILID